MKINTITLSHTSTLAFCSIAFLGICSAASAQNLFVGTYGGQIIEIPTSGPQSTFASGLGSIAGMAFDSSGDLFVSDQSNGKIDEYVNSGGTLSSTPTIYATGLNQVGLMAINSVGDLFVDENSTTIEEYTAPGVGTPYITGLSGDQGVAFDKNGNLFVAAVNGGGSTSGAVDEYFAGGGSTTYASGLNFPVGLTFDGVGNLLVSSGNGAGIITKITPGEVKTPYASGLDQPTTMAFNNAGDLFVADQGIGGSAGNITEFSLTGQETLYNSTISKPVALAFQGVALPVPEPTTFGLLGLGALAAVARFKSKKSNR